MTLDPRSLFPRDLRDIGLYDQVLFAVTRIVSDFETDLTDSVEKYFHFDTLPKDLLEAIIYEQGYRYITDVLNLSEERTRNMTQLISLIHFYKGHRTGLLLVLDLLGFAGSETLEWWEQTPEGEPDTFKLTLNLNVSDIDVTAIPRLLSFVESYVYPVLEELILVADILDGDYVVLGTSAETIPCSIVTHL